MKVCQLCSAEKHQMESFEVGSALLFLKLAWEWPLGPGHPSSTWWDPVHGQGPFSPALRGTCLARRFYTAVVGAVQVSHLSSWGRVWLNVSQG